jgi:hypothetical protein
LLVLAGCAVLFLAVAALTGSLIVWVLEVMVDAGLIAFVVHLRRMARAAVATRRAPVVARRVVADAPAAQRRPTTTAERQQQRRWEHAQTDVGDYGEQVTVRYAASRPAEPAYREADYAEPVYAEPVYAEPVYAEPEYAEPLFDEQKPVAATADCFFDQYAIADLEPEPQPVAEVVAPAPPPVAEPSYSAYTGPGFIEAGVRKGREEPAARTAPPAAEPVVEAPIAAPTVGGSPWEPVPVPPPTYAMKPAAPPRRPRFERDEPLLPPVEPTPELSAADDLEEILDRRWAVND